MYIYKYIYIDSNDTIDQVNGHHTIDGDSNDLNHKNLTIESDENQDVFNPIENGSNNLTVPNSIHEKLVPLNKGVDSTAAAWAFIWQVNLKSF
jgi:hypothetical protein